MSNKNVNLVGFINQTELPTYYAAADVFVLPSHYETWGLVLNEAMACGLPGIVSDTCGAIQDMIGVTCFNLLLKTKINLKNYFYPNTEDLYHD